MGSSRLLLFSMMYVFSGWNSPLAHGDSDIFFDGIPRKRELFHYNSQVYSYFPEPYFANFATDSIFYQVGYYPSDPRVERFPAPYAYEPKPAVQQVFSPFEPLVNDYNLNRDAFMNLVSIGIPRPLLQVANPPLWLASLDPKRPCRFKARVDDVEAIEGIQSFSECRNFCDQFQTRRKLGAGTCSFDSELVYYGYNQNRNSCQITIDFSGPGMGQERSVSTRVASGAECEEECLKNRRACGDAEVLACEYRDAIGQRVMLFSKSAGAGAPIVSAAGAQVLKCQGASAQVEYEVLSPVGIQAADEGI